MGSFDFGDTVRGISFKSQKRRFFAIQAAVNLSVPRVSSPQLLISRLGVRVKLTVTSHVQYMRQPHILRNVWDGVMKRFFLVRMGL